MAAVEKNLLMALGGHVTTNTKLPQPRIIKIYVASLKEDFKEERRILLENIGPDLQLIYDDNQIEIEIVDMHFGTGEGPSLNTYDPYITEDYLNEIEACAANSKSIFFIGLIGTTFGLLNLPIKFDKEIYDFIIEKCDINNDDILLLKKWYKINIKNLYYELDTEFRKLNNNEWYNECGKLRIVFNNFFKKNLTTIHNDYNHEFCDKIKQINVTILEMELNKAIECNPNNMLVIFREWCNGSDTIAKDNTVYDEIKNNFKLKLPETNYAKLCLDDDNETEIDVENEKHEKYLLQFKRTILEKIRNAVDASLANDPDGGKGRKKTVQEIFHEHATHLMYLNEHLNTPSLISSNIPDIIKENVLRSFRTGARHSPYFIYGDYGTGKSSLLAELYTQSATWFDSNQKISRIIRFSKATPRSAYNLELMRVICQQISIIFDIPEGYLPKDASFDPLYINNWFQNLLRRCEDLKNEILFLFIDDLHKLNPLDCDIVAALSWLPISLPWNVYLICTTRITIDSLKLTPMQKERFKSGESFYDVNKFSVKVKKVNENESFDCYINKKFNMLEGHFGKKGIGRLATYITCSEYGLSETELLELLMPTFNSEALIDTHEGDFNFSSFKTIRRYMAPLIREKLMSGKILIEWRHDLCSEISKRRYILAAQIPSIHEEIANIFFPPDAEECDDSSEANDSDRSQKSQEKQPPVPVPPPVITPTTIEKPRTESIVSVKADISYTTRHVEEAWHHLLQASNTDKLKIIAVCNFDFLLASVQTVSISYLRCLIEHVRCFILDRDIELIYYTIRKSSDVITRDVMQLGAQIICWLRPISEHEFDNSLLGITVRSATAWCDGHTVPLLVPLTGWLPVPLPSQIRTMTISGGPVRCMELAPSKQHLIISPSNGEAQLWHIMSNCVVHKFKGHSGPVTCMIAPKNRQQLITGSDDTSVIVWDMQTLSIKLRIWEHIAAVLCVTVALNNTLMISGGDDSSIIIASLNDGILKMKIDHHRGPVTAVKISTSSDVLVSSSLDRTVCLWSLDDYTLLNTFQLAHPILKIEISSDSVFLLAQCEDNGLYLRTLATGTELHTLKGHKSKIRALSLAMDSQRAVVGCEDAKAMIYDMHSGKVIRTFPPNPGAVTALFIFECDDFLITAGGNKVTFYSFRNEDAVAYCTRRKRKPIKHSSISSRANTNSSGMPINCFDISRDSQFAAVGTNKIVEIIQLNTPATTSILEGHTGIVTCVSFAPNCEFVVSGSEDRTVNVWGLNLGLIVTTFKGHAVVLSSVVVMMDSRRVISADRDGLLCVWIQDSGTLLQTVQGPHKCLAITNNMKYAVCTNGDSALKIWSLTREDEKYIVSHSEEITCFVITVDSLYIITGSRDMSLKVWQATGGKLAQVLVGHTDAVTCCAVSVTNKSQVISGSKDCNLIIWDLHTGEEIHTLAGHLAQVTCVKVSADGTTAISGSDDKTLIVWETKRGLALTSLQLHVPFSRFDITLDCSRILVQLADSACLAVICLHNTPASFIKLPTYSAPARDVEDLRPSASKRQPRRLLKKEVSLDTYTWQKKYGHLSSSVMMAQVDERLKRRFSVSASMEEISKITELKSIASQVSIGPEQAALAQSQHFDQLEALWNKRSPPRRRLNQSLSRQSSLVEDRIESSDEDEFQEERSGNL